MQVGIMKHIAQVAITVIALLLFTSEARADCADPYQCICFGERYVARVVDVIIADNGTVTANIEAETVAVGGTVSVGDQLVVDAFEGIEVDSRWLMVIFDQQKHWLRQSEPARETIKCLGQDFGLQQSLDLSVLSNCRSRARFDAGVSEDDLACEDTASCNVAANNPPSQGRWITLALLLFVALTRRCLCRDASGSGRSRDR
jgi:hypothetical protein